jgi:hypothetical protein
VKASPSLTILKTHHQSKLKLKKNLPLVELSMYGTLNISLPLASVYNTLKKLEIEGCNTSREIPILINLEKLKIKKTQEIDCFPSGLDSTGE